jgi:hypothetical protein
MMLHLSEGMCTGEGTAILDCHDLQQAMHEDIVQTLLLSMWDADAPDTSTEEASTPTDRKTKNRLSAQQSRVADKEYVNLMLAELESLTKTFEMYTAYITQLKVHAADAVDSMARLEQMHEQNKSKIAMLQQSDTVSAVPTLMGMPTKERNRIHAQKSRQRKQQYVQDLIQQRDESWSTMQEVMQYTTALEGACSVLHDFDDTGFVLLQLTETRQTLLMRTGSHKRKYEELKTRMAYRLRQREKF